MRLDAEDDAPASDLVDTDAVPEQPKSAAVERPDSQGTDGSEPVAPASAQAEVDEDDD
jgi:hypothetical protein